ncbi:hypothetical protein PIB30_097884 [Stylosanthes scabra]|uniref:Uncharacterized protein n=1 Tax=Stylosanthes scabra TaxID=79078 RepID=A0ABU6VXA5_9FABA|nr:hypothetical protein [Stylosanthes scabra]
MATRRYRSAAPESPRRGGKSSAGSGVGGSGGAMRRRRRGGARLGGGAGGGREMMEAKLNWGKLTLNPFTSLVLFTHSLRNSLTNYHHHSRREYLVQPSLPLDFVADFSLSKLRFHRSRPCGSQRIRLRRSRACSFVAASASRSPFVSRASKPTLNEDQSFICNLIRGASAGITSKFQEFMPLRAEFHRPQLCRVPYSSTELSLSLLSSSASSTPLHSHTLAAKPHRVSTLPSAISHHRRGANLFSSLPLCHFRRGWVLNGNLLSSSLRF